MESGRKFLNEEPFSHASRWGTQFFGERCDLRGGVNVVKPKGISELHLCMDFASFAAWHANCIFSQLNGFSGYDAVQYHIIEEG